MSIVVDQSSYLGAPIPTDLILVSFCRILGSSLINFVPARQHLGTATKKFPCCKSILRETIVQLRKP